MARIFMRFPDGKSKAFTVSYDDGFEPDVRLMGILKRNGLKGTFNLNSGVFGQDYEIGSMAKTYRRLDSQQAKALYAESGMEIAVHGFTHADLKQLPANLCTMEVANDRMNLERQFHRIVRGMAYANGSFDEKVTDCLRCCGIAYARTTISTGDFRLPSDWYRLTATCHHGDERLMELACRFLEETVRKDARLFYVWGHSFELDAGNGWNRIEKFAEYIGGRQEIWYATNIEIYDYIKAYQGLVFSMDNSLVYNPAVIEVFFEIDGRTVKVAPGETIQLCRN